MRFLIIIYSNFLVFITNAQCILISWNVCNMGKSKDLSEIYYMSRVIKHADVICLQEINMGPDGAKAVAILADYLNRSGAKWDYTVSEVTNSEGPERYAFLWKTKFIKMNKGVYLEKRLDKTIDREPAICIFTYKNQAFIVASIHAVPKNKEPWRELKHLYLLQNWYEKDKLLIVGDFNTPASHDIFDRLRSKNLNEAIQGKKTTLKTKVIAQTHLANPYDHIWYDTADILPLDAGNIDFSTDFADLKQARKISDHLPVYIKFDFK